MPVIRTRCPTASPYRTQDDGVADADTQGFREVASVDRRGQPPRRVDDQRGLAGADVVEGPGASQGDRAGLVRVELDLALLVEPRPRQVLLLRGELDVAEPVDGEHAAPDLARGDLRPRHRDPYERTDFEGWTERAEVRAGREVRGGGSEHVSAMERVGRRLQDDV